MFEVYDLSSFGQGCYGWDWMNGIFEIASQDFFTVNIQQRVNDIIIIMILLLLATLLHISSPCPQLASLSILHTELDPTLLSTLSSLQQQPKLQCITYLFKRGMFDLAFTLAQNSTLPSQQIRSLFKLHLTQLNTLSKSVITGNSTIQPVIKWGQSQDQVLITFKLSHRWDTPICNQPYEQEYYIKDQSILVYNSRCIVSRQNFHFKINLRMKEKVIPNTLILKKDGVGTYIVSVAKVDIKTWLSLGEDGERRPIWNDAVVKYPKAMEEYFQEVEKAKSGGSGSEKLVIQSSGGQREQAQQL